MSTLVSGGSEVDLDFLLLTVSAAVIVFSASKGTARQQRDVNQCLASLNGHIDRMWKLVSSAPFDRDLELLVIDEGGPHALVFPCRRILGGWMNVATKQKIEVKPTHWWEWTELF